MTAPNETEQVISSYLNEIAHEAAALPADRRAELITDISEHIAAARASGEASTTQGVRDLLSRLGPPRDIVAAEYEGHDFPLRPIVVQSPPGTKAELAAVLLLTLGSVVIPLIGWAAGVILLWLSRWWTPKEKVLGTLVWPGGYLGLLFVMSVPAQSCFSSSTTDSNGVTTITAENCEGFALPTALAIPTALVWLVAPVVVAMFLYRRAQRRATDASSGRPYASSAAGDSDDSA